MYENTVLKSDCQFYKWPSLKFKKNESLGTRKEKLVKLAIWAVWRTQLVRNKLHLVYGHTEVWVTNYFSLADLLQFWSKWNQYMK